MTKAETVDATATVRVENVGGIDQTAVDIPPGVTILEGRNTTNRTSFLRAIMGAIGSDDVMLKSDSDKGHIELSIGEETYTRILRRTDSGVTLTGDPYMDDPTLADCFAFLLESNEARQAVAQKADLRDIIMRPVDIDEIRAEIDRLDRERDRIDDQLEEFDDLKDELFALEERRTELESEIEEKRAELADMEAKIESMDAEISETLAEKQELKDRLTELRDLRSELEVVRSEIDLQEESIKSLRTERSKLQDELAELPATPIDHQDLEDEIARLRKRKQTLEAEMSDLQDVIQFNEEMLDGEVDAVTSVLGTSSATVSALTDQLVEDEPVVCWTCGSEVDRERIDETIDKLRAVRQGYLEDVRELEADLEELRETQREQESQQRRRETLERKLSETEDELNRRQEALEDLRERRERLNEQVEAVEQEVKQLESEDFSAVLDLHKEANQLEFELGQLESNLDDITDRIATIEDRLTEEDDLRAKREQVQVGLQDQRTRIERIEQDAIKQFNEHMDEVLELLEYDNLARIWIERVQKTVREGRRKTEQTAFEFHVVRTTDTNITYEDTIDHLSESEREVTGLVFALAGYLVHDVHELVPVMLLDSVEAIDAERLSDLVAYFSEYVEYLIIALLPEDAQAIATVDTRITDI